MIMTDQELTTLLNKLDDRYVSQEDFERELLAVADLRYAKRGDLMEALGKIDALTMQNSQHSDLLQNIYDTLQKNTDRMASNNSKLETIEIHLNEAHKSEFKRLVESTSMVAIVIKSTFIVLGICIMLMVLTAFIGHGMNEFMSRNGLDVAIITMVVTIVLNYIGVKKK